MGISKDLFSRKIIWVLFSVCAFPIHVWTFILFFNDFSWIAERTNAWDAVGVGAYGLMIALVESCFVLVFILFLSIFLPKNLLEDKKISILGVLVILASLWSVTGQLYFLLELKLPPDLIHALAKNPHPLRMIYLGLFPIVSVSIVIPVALILWTEKLGKWIINFFKRLTTLTALYIFLDLCGLIIVLIRNL